MKNVVMHVPYEERMADRWYEKYSKQLHRKRELEYAKYSNLPKRIPLDLVNETKEN